MKWRNIKYEISEIKFVSVENAFMCIIISEKKLFLLAIFKFNYLYVKSEKL